MTDEFKNGFKAALDEIDNYAMSEAKGFQSGEDDLRIQAILSAEAHVWDRYYEACAKDGGSHAD